MSMDLDEAKELESLSPRQKMLLPTWVNRTGIYRRQLFCFFAMCKCGQREVRATIAAGLPRDEGIENALEACIRKVMPHLSLFLY